MSESDQSNHWQFLVNILGAKPKEGVEATTPSEDAAATENPSEAPSQSSPARPVKPAKPARRTGETIREKLTHWSSVLRSVGVEPPPDLEVPEPDDVESKPDVVEREPDVVERKPDVVEREPFAIEERAISERESREPVAEPHYEVPAAQKSETPLAEGADELTTWPNKAKPESTRGERGRRERRRRAGSRS